MYVTLDGIAEDRPTYDGPKWLGARRSCIVWATEGESVSPRAQGENSLSGIVGVIQNTVVGEHLLNSHPRTMLQEYTCTTGIKAGLCLLTNNWILLLYLKPAGTGTFAGSPVFLQPQILATYMFTCLLTLSLSLFLSWDRSLRCCRYMFGLQRFSPGPIFWIRIFSLSVCLLQWFLPGKEYALLLSTFQDFPR